MRKPVKLRTLTTEETAEIRRLAASRTASFRMVQRARLIASMLDDPNLYASEAGKRVGFRSPIMGVTWVRRFDEGWLLLELLFPEFRELRQSLAISTRNRSQGSS